VSLVRQPRVFRYAVATARTDTDPAALLKGALVAPRVKHHAALIDPADVGQLLRAIDAYAFRSTAPLSSSPITYPPRIICMCSLPHYRDQHPG
jgi:hypothetical protein